MTNLDLTITPGAFARPARLRADRIRRDTLTALAAALREDHDSSLINAIHALVDAVHSPHDTEGAEIDELVADIEHLAGMDDAAVDLSDADMRQLAEQAGAALSATTTVSARWAA